MNLELPNATQPFEVDINLRNRFTRYFDPVFSVAMATEPKMAARYLDTHENYIYSGKTNPDITTPEYEENVAGPARRLSKSIHVIYDLRSPPGLPQYLDRQGVEDILRSQYLETPDSFIGYRMIQKACHYLELNPTELLDLTAYAITMNDAEALESKIKLLQQEAADTRAQAIKFIYESKMRRYSAPHE